MGEIMTAEEKITIIKSILDEYWTKGIETNHTEHKVLDAIDAILREGD